MKSNKPQIKKIEKKLSIHDDVRIDNYYWLNRRDSKEVIDHLNAENLYSNEVLKNTNDLKDNLFEEMKSRIKEDDSSVPYFYNDYWYIKKFKKGKEFPIYTRKFKQLSNKEEIILDVNLLAKDHEYFSIGSLSISPNNKILAYSCDVKSRRLYTIHFVNLLDNKNVGNKIADTSGSITWAKDNKTIFYVKKDPQTLRLNKIYKHNLESNNKDVLVFEEKDEEFSCIISRTKSEKYIVINSHSTLTTECRFIDSSRPDSDFKIFNPREKGHEYSIEHYNDNFFIITNKDAKNFKIMKCPILETTFNNWEAFIDHRPDFLIEDLEIFSDYYVIAERNMGLLKLNVNSWENNESYIIPFDNETYTAYMGINLDFNSNKLRYHFSSLNTPSSVIEYNFISKKNNILKVQEVIDDNFNSKNYITERVWAKSHDNIEIPISIVRHKNTIKSSETPLLLYAYGSYGHTVDPYFSSVRLSLLDRGFIFAIAHIRGGEYLGREWYDNGKLLKKKNTFFDFIECGKFLINKKYTSKKHLYAMGGSAGGLLMGVIVNLEPTLFKGVIAAVPFVDVVTTMLDDSIPLTTLEYNEWGNPNDKDYYSYIKSYSPYDNISEKNYPYILATTGYHDSQVQYWEPAKWVAKLRDHNNSENPILLHTNMDTGHGGASGRFKILKEVAMEYAFLIGIEKQLL
tara:strand:+ start:1398 stop:3446 length:2049 start_codon:yes stop_codon:yes gene_type:complete